MGSDGTMWYAEKFHQPASEYLLNLFNRILVKNSFPVVWFTAYVVPILKLLKDRHWEDSVRPIALLCETYKLMEKMVAKIDSILC